MGRSRGANGLPEGHQIPVPCFPVSSWQQPAQGHFRLQRRPGRDQSQPVADPVDVDIDADPRFIEGFGHNQVGGLASHSREPHQVLDRVGDTSAEKRGNRVGQLLQQSCLGAVESDGEDQLGQHVQRDAAEVIEILNFAKQTLRYGGGRLVFGARAQDGGHQHAKRGQGTDRHKVGNRRGLVLEMGADAAMDEGDQIGVSVRGVHENGGSSFRTRVQEPCLGIDDSPAPAKFVSITQKGSHIMQKESLDFLRQMIGTASPSGFEWRIQEVLKRHMRPFCDEVRADVHGNVIGVINPKAGIRVMLSGHCDEIGLMVMHIDDHGFLYFAAVGGVDTAVISGQRVKVHAAQGEILGVIGRKPIHLLEQDERGKPAKMHELFIDIGAKKRKEAERHVSVGDYVTIDVGLEPMLNNLVAGRGFDDRAGAFVVAETLRKLKGRKLRVGVYGVTSVQEEIGLRGAQTSAFGIDPHVGIAVDVGFASDFPGCDPKRTGECFLGKGPTLHRGPNINPVLGRLLEATAKKRRIPCQVTAEPRATGTDANAMQVNRAGVATALVSVPNRYMHTPVEMISLDDLDNTSKLLAEFLVELDPAQKFIPGL